MPPKKKVESAKLTIQFKCDTTSVFLLVPPSASLNSIRGDLATALNETGVLYNTGHDDDDIDIPMPNNGVLQDDDDDESDGPDGNEEKEEQENHAPVMPNDLRFGLPSDKDPSRYIQVSDYTAPVSELGLQEHSQLAFVVGDGDFAVEEPSYDD